ncbi:MAG TPA: ATP-binding protein [Ramlibacter sp.]|uniref:ATP-binding protein n=1 Tax=Ramlibacter sp. TaxID=1917967 RepID=UPI002B823F93|nr:ATP-binding protein [Ramlibacter sp.]HVZ44038.1 ATP-binding protein [Ramlibacter sp.]
MKPREDSHHSLRRRLLWLILAAIAAASLVQGASAYRTAVRQADAMFDYHLEELARSVHAGVIVAPDPTRSYDLLVQVWGPDGVQQFRSSGIELPPQAVLGFSDAQVNGVRYRLYSLQTPQHTIRIAQNLDARRAQGRAMAIQAVLPIALLAPILMLAVGWLINRSLAPVERMRRQVAHRAADDLSPLPDEGMPLEVLPLVRELNLLFARVGDAFAQQQTFVDDAAHELRSPLTALKLQAQALKRAQDPAEREAAIASLNEGIERAIQLVAQLLALAREQGREGGRRAAEAPRRVDLQDVARQAAADVLPHATERRIDVGLVTDEPVQVSGDADALRILLRNLLDNAVKYSPAGGRVDISLGHTKARPWLVVEDSGPGIAAEQRERVFDRFYRVAGGDVAGSGLGLAIVKTIAERYGATVELGRSERLGGLRVELTFPASPPGEAEARP